ncbi:ABC transporter ATP-binding protein, partial [Campylobacter sp. 7477a]|nr:ABC transporter ATP-binding protein [Campylobacter sp. 7477a]
MYAIEVKNLTHFYGEKLIYQNLNFSVKTGN